MPAQLCIWQEAHSLALEIYKVSNSFPPEERYGLRSQIRSAATSAPSNIAEGKGRGTTKDFIRFLIQARGSVQEVIYQLLLARDLHYVSAELHKELTDRYNGLNAGINRYVQSLKTRESLRSP